MAQDRASKPYRERSTTLPDVLAKLNYDQYRDIRFRRTSALWYDHAMFEVQFFHRGFQFDRRVNIYELVGNQVRAVPYNPAMFEFGKQVPPVKLPAELGFAGLPGSLPVEHADLQGRAARVSGRLLFPRAGPQRALRNVRARPGDQHRQ